jgi:hypothetical protein
MKSQEIHTILVIAEKPARKSPLEEDRKWTSFLLNTPGTISRISKDERIAENVWQIRGGAALILIHDFQTWGMEYGIPIRILFLEDTPSWQCYPQVA